jgi:hypothetical protein
VFADIDMPQGPKLPDVKELYSLFLEESDTYESGAWEFRETYVCIELRLGSYPFQKFRVRPSSGYSGVTVRRNKNSIKYEPWVMLNNHKFPFRRQETADKAALIRDVAKFCLCIQGKDYNFSQGRYTHLRQIPTRYSESEIRRFVEETFKLLQFEEALNAETPTWQAPNIVNGDQIVLGGVADVQQDAISDQPLHVELGTPGSKHTMTSYLPLECFVIIDYSSMYLLNQTRGRTIFVDSSTLGIFNLIILLES